MTAFPPSPAAGLYLHVPFCSAVCPYCDFAVMVGGPVRRKAYLEALSAETDLQAGQAEPLGPFDTVYLGGGTPSALAADELAAVLDHLRGTLAVQADAWLFLEANPEDVCAASLAAWRGLGARTLSLGVQSFDPVALAFLGRRHDPGTARRAVEAARAAGFATVSVDLIYGLPGQESGDWRRDLAAAVALEPDHLSCYQLTVHEGTAFGQRQRRGELTELPNDAQGDLFALTHDLLADAGWTAYEVSNFARAPEHESRHNRKYWEHAPYLGLGPSAHSFGGLRPGGGTGPAGHRWWNERRLGPYRGRIARGELPVAGEERLGAEELALERLMLALRTPAGLDLEAFQTRYGVDLVATDGTRIERLVAGGLLTLTGVRLAPTRRGLAVADGLVAGFALR